MQELGKLAESQNELIEQQKKAEKNWKPIKRPKLEQELVKVDLNSKSVDGRYKLAENQRVIMITDRNICWILETKTIEDKDQKGSDISANR